MQKSFAFLTRIANLRLRVGTLYTFQEDSMRLAGIQKALAASALLVLCWAPTGLAGTFTVTNLGTLGGNSYAYGVNSSGEVVGYSQLADFHTEHAFLWDGTMHDLGTLGGASSHATGINDNGVVVGYSQVANG